MSTLDRVIEKHIGVLAVLCASIIWAVEPIVARFSFLSADVVQTSGIRAMFAAVTAFVFVVVSKKSVLRVKRRQLPSFFYIAVVGTLVADLLYFLGLTLVPVVNAVLIGHMQPVFIMLMAWVVLRQDQLTGVDYVGIVIMIVAAVFVTSGSFERLMSLQIGRVGDVVVLMATVAWASAAIVMRKFVREVHTGVLTFYRFFIASMVFSGYLLINNHLFIENYYQIILGILIGIGTILYYEGLKRLKAAQVGALELSTPFFAAILGFFVLHEQVTSFQIIGILLVCVGVYMLSRKETS